MPKPYRYTVLSVANDGTAAHVVSRHRSAELASARAMRERPHNAVVMIAETFAGNVRISSRAFGDALAALPDAMRARVSAAVGEALLRDRERGAAPAHALRPIAETSRRPVRVVVDGVSIFSLWHLARGADARVRDVADRINAKRADGSPCIGYAATVDGRSIQIDLI